jgi:hypothetical protein
VKIISGGVPEARVQDVRWWRRSLARLIAADPGLRRLRAAAQVIVAVLVALAVAVPGLSALGQPLTAVAPAAVVAMMSLLAVREGGTRTRVITTLLLPVSATTAIALAAAARGSPVVGELVFLAVMFVAVYVRRFGPRAFALGMVAFIGYFLALFLQAQLSAVPAMSVAAFVGAGAAVLARFVMLRERPDRAWTRGVRSLQARVRTLLHAMDDRRGRPESPEGQRRVHDELLRLNATALALGTGFDALSSLPDERADELRGHVLDVELTAGALVAAVDGLLDDGASAPTVAQVTAVLQDDVGRAAVDLREIADHLDGAGSPVVALAVRRVSAAARDLDAATRAMQRVPDFGTAGEPADPQAAEGAAATRTGRARTGWTTTSPPGAGCCRPPGPRCRWSSPGRSRSSSAGSSRPASGSGR